MHCFSLEPLDCRQENCSGQNTAILKVDISRVSPEEETDRPTHQHLSRSKRTNPIGALAVKKYCTLALKITFPVGTKIFFLTGGAIFNPKGFPLGAIKFKKLCISLAAILGK